jgi:hypothetical protein
MTERRERSGGPWWSRLLSERGLGTVLAVVLTLALLWFGVRVVNDMQTFQAQTVIQLTQTNEQLAQLEIAHARMQIQLERLEALILAANANQR